MAKKGRRGAARKKPAAQARLPHMLSAHGFHLLWRAMAHVSGCDGHAMGRYVHALGICRTSRNHRQGRHLPIFFGRLMAAVTVPRRGAQVAVARRGAQVEVARRGAQVVVRAQVVVPRAR